MSPSPEISVVIPTRNRHRKLERLLSTLRAQSFLADHFEVLVVDDASAPPVTLDGMSAENIRVIRLEPSERSAARNRSAQEARAPLLVFVDDDMLATRRFLEAHLEAQRSWPGALSVGAVTLPPSALEHPFGRFRAALEAQAMPPSPGLVNQPNFCTASNMSIPTSRFLELGGFNPTLVSSEDQDLALRHTSRGGHIVFVPDAAAIHDDENLDIRSYCRRHEWGAEHMVPFCTRHPDLPDNRERVRLCGPLRPWSEPPSLSVRKTVKALLGTKPACWLLFALTDTLERRRPGSPVLPALYKALLGIHLRRGFRRGWSRTSGCIERSDTRACR